MDDVLTDAEIEQCISMKKTLPDDYENRIVPKARTGHKGAELEVVGEDGKTRFFLMVRVSEANQLDFTAILAVYREASGSRFLLRRYNGKSHPHANNVEKEAVFYDFHIHYATEKYQRAGRREEGYAKSDRPLRRHSRCGRLSDSRLRIRRATGARHLFSDKV